MFSSGLHQVLRGTLTNTTGACPKKSNRGSAKSEAKSREEQVTELKILGLKIYIFN